MRRRSRFTDEEPYDEKRDDLTEPTDEGEPVELDDVLEPYDDAEHPVDYASYADYGAKDEPVYNELYEDYDDAPVEDEDDDPAGRFRVAMSVFNVTSILLGVVAILVLSALLISLFSWLTSDIQHSVLLLQSNLQ